MPVTDAIRKIPHEPIVHPKRRVYHVATAQRHEGIESFGAIVSAATHGQGCEHWMSDRDAVFFWPTRRLASLWQKFMEDNGIPCEVWSADAPARWHFDDHWEIADRGMYTYARLTNVKCIAGTKIKRRRY